MSSSAWNRASCLDTSWGWTLASASRRVMRATTCGVGVGSDLGREKIEPRLIKRRELGRDASVYF